MQQGLGTRGEQEKCNREETGRGSGRRPGFELWDGIRDHEARIQRLLFVRRLYVLRVCERGKFYGPLYEGCASVYVYGVWLCVVVEGVCVFERAVVVVEACVCDNCKAAAQLSVAIQHRVARSGDVVHLAGKIRRTCILLVQVHAGIAQVFHKKTSKSCNMADSYNSGTEARHEQ